MNSLTDRAVSSGLMSKVTSILIPGLLTTALGTYLGAGITNTWVWVALLVPFFFGNYFVSKAGKISHALGTAVFMGWSLVTGLIMGPAIHQYLLHDGWQLIFNAYAFTTLAMCGFGAYGYLTSKNFSSWILPLFFALIALLVVMIFALFVPVGGFVNVLIGIAGMVLFSFLFIFDFNRAKFEEDNWDSAWDVAANIQLNYVNFLLFFLRVFGGVGKD